MSFLVPYLPDEGFQWVSEYHTPFITPQQAQNIWLAMDPYRGQIDPRYAMQNVEAMFRAATPMVDKCEKMTPAEFWEKVGAAVPWAHWIKGADLHAFSRRIISARSTFCNEVQAYRDMSMNPIDIPKMYRQFTHTSANKAVDIWTEKFVNRYGLKSKTRNLYYPESTNSYTAEDSKKDQGVEGRNSKTGGDGEGSGRRDDVELVEIGESDQSDMGIL
ncbi:hypothetical protein F4804DRAFT_312876 [Jackrogersella minutella]|nr:hypothetical protein F4804DRAFT_312876 [Jackrogersella minutella]